MDFIEVFEITPDLNSNDSVMVLDSWQSLRVRRNFTKPNEFTLVVESSESNLKYLRARNHIRIGTVLYDIETIQASDESLKVIGRSMSHALNRDFMHVTYSKNAIEPEMAVRELIWGLAPQYFMYVDKLEPFSNFKIRYQATYKSYLDLLIEFCETYDFGYVETYHAKGEKLPVAQYKHMNMLSIVQGEDLSDKVVFSAENENLLSENLEVSYKDYKDYAHVFGEGEGIGRKVVTVDLGNPVELHRSRLYVDARDLQSEVEDGVFLSDAEYEAILYERGVQKLAEHAPIFSLSGTIDAKSKLFKLGVDYDVGDIVTIESEKFNIKTNLQITSIQETWDSAGYHIDPVFGRESPTIFEKLRR